MSAPQTNLEKQGRRHRGPIIGIIAVVVFALTLFLFLPSNPADPVAPTGTGNVTEPVDPPLTPDGDLPPVEAPTPAPDLPTEPLPDTGTPTP